MRKTGDFHTIKDILGKIFSNAKGDSQLKKYSLWEQWDSLVGDPVAKKTTPLRWLKNTLVVGVKDSCWLQELRMREKEILEKVRQGRPDLKIDGIRWVLS